MCHYHTLCRQIGACVFAWVKCIHECSADTATVSTYLNCLPKLCFWCSVKAFVLVSFSDHLISCQLLPIMWETLKIHAHFPFSMTLTILHTFIMKRQKTKSCFTAVNISYCPSLCLFYLLHPFLARSREETKMHAGLRT